MSTPSISAESYYFNRFEGSSFNSFYGFHPIMNYFTHMFYFCKSFRLKMSPRERLPIVKDYQIKILPTSSLHFTPCTEHDRLQLLFEIEPQAFEMQLPINSPFNVPSCRNSARTNALFLIVR